MKSLELRIGLVAGTVALAALPAGAQLDLEQVTTGLSAPVAITSAYDGSGRLFITEQGGRIRIYKDGVLLPAPFLDISSLISSGGERGLLSVAFHPAYLSNGRFFVFYTDQAGALTIARYSVSADPDVADPSSALVLKSIPHPGAANHNGGQLQFGPDGYLYAGTGDGGGGGDPFGNAQNLGVLLGKILRLDVDGASLIPADNPFVDGDPATLDEIWAYGLRNPWRFGFDRATGDLYIGDVGQGCWEEVDRHAAGSAAGENFGWNVMEGDHCYSSSTCSAPPTCIDPAFSMPILTYSHADPADCAIVGGYRYRGSRIPTLTGVYLYADYCSGRIWGASPTGGVWAAAPLFDTPFNITSFGEDEAGELYVADSGSGAIYRIIESPATPYSDDFEDGDASDWVAIEGRWSVAQGDLTNAPSRRATILAPYPGCSLCEIDANLTIGTPGGRASLLGWYRDDRNFVELRLADRSDRIVLRRVARGKVGSSVSARQTLAPGGDYHVRIAFDGSRYLVYFSDGPTPILSMDAPVPAAGKIGFRATGAGGRRAVGLFHDISVH